MTESEMYVREYKARYDELVNSEYLGSQIHARKRILLQLIEEEEQKIIDNCKES